MNNNVSQLRWLLGLGLIFAMACGDTGSPQPPTPTQGFAQGPITQFGSIFVNGTKFDTDNAVIVGADGTDTSIDDLNQSLGQVVVVEGEFDPNGTTGTATRVVFKSELKGPVESVLESTMDGPVGGPEVVVAKKLMVLGITVSVEDGYTAFADGYSVADDVNQGDIVEVSGLPDANGDIRATRIEKVVGWDGQVEIRGESTGFTGLNDYSEGVLTMKGKDVSYNGTTTFEPANFDKNRFSSSVFIEVEGTLDPATPSVIVATKIEEEDDFGEDAGKISVEGFVSGYVDDSEFFVGSQQVDASGATFIPAGLPLKDNDEVEVEGPLVGGILQATEVKFEGEESEVSATIEAGALGNNTLTLLGSIVIGFDSGTRWEDKAEGANENAPFNFSSLRETDFVEVKVVETAGGNWVATRIERYEAHQAGEIEVEGKVGESCADAASEIAPCEAAQGGDPDWVGKAWVEVLGLRVEIRDTGPQTVLEVDEVPFMGTVADFIGVQIGTNFLELEIDPSTPTAPHLALKAEVKTAGSD